MEGGGEILMCFADLCKKNNTIVYVPAPNPSSIPTNMLVLNPIFIAFLDVFFGIFIVIGYILTDCPLLCSVPLSTPEMSKSSSGNLIADVIEKARPGIPVRLYTDNKVGLSFYFGDFLKGQCHEIFRFWFFS
jgi:hypothetical protein